MRNKTILIELNEIRKPNTNLVILRVLLDSEYTRIDFGYIATSHFIKGGWIRIAAETHLNIQGDEPFVNPENIDLLLMKLAKSPASIGTLYTPFSEMSEVTSSNRVKVTTDINGLALSFSRSVMPFNKIKLKPEDYKKHLGVYGFKTNDDLYWNWQYTKDVYDETQKSYKDSHKKFIKDSKI